MARTIMLIPVGAGVGLTSASMGVLRAMEQKGVRVSFFKPIAQPRQGGNKPDLTTTLVQANSTIQVAEPITMSAADTLIREEQMDVLLEDIVARYNEVSRDADVTLIEGLIQTNKYPFANKLNRAVATTLDAEMVFIAAPNDDSPEELQERIATACSNYGGTKNPRIIGTILNKLSAPETDADLAHPDLSEVFSDTKTENYSAEEFAQAMDNHPLPVLAAIPWHINLIAARAMDVANHLNATILNKGDLETRRIKSISFCARSVEHTLNHFRPGSLLVTTADRPALVIAACLAALNGVEIGALLLTGDYELPQEVKDLCQRAFETGLPVLSVPSNTWQTSVQLHSLNLETPADDKQRVDFTSDYVAGTISSDWIASLSEGSDRGKRLSPPAFRYQLTELARQAKKRIVLPEGAEPRTVRAAAICAEKGIATCVLIGDPVEIKRVAEQQGVELGNGIEIINPADVIENYVERMVELRSKKGLTDIMAREQLQDSVVLGTMMLEKDEVDGLVSGAVHTTANTIRPPLQLIKTAPNSSLVSSVFFMLMPDQVYVYGDCAINPDPTAEQLSEIAIQSAESAAAFGIEPRVAMISYSTGTSGQGADVDKVRQATELAKAKRPDLMIDGPLQYDAAVMENVAASKAPDSPVAGKATVFVFPDLNTGNTTYKAVQRSADLVSIGPMLQGMRKPVNDLSRGALVEDIVYTIALTAIQAGQND